MSTPETRAVELSFLAPPGELADWRLVLAYEAAAVARVFDALPGRVAEIAARCELHEGALRAVLGLLLAWGIIGEDVDGVYAAGPRAPSSAEHTALLRHAATIHRWAGLLGPRLRDRAAGAPPPPIPASAGTDPLALAARRVTGPVVDACLRCFPHAYRALDLGGGHGEYSLELVRRGLRPTMQDRPAVVENADRDGRLGGAGVELFAGDFTTTLPQGPFDLVLCAMVTNMLDERTNRDLYRRLRVVLAPDGGLVIVSYMRGRNEVTASFGLQMLVWTDGGDAHGVDDYRSWLADAGYGLVQVSELADPPLTIVLAGC